MLTDEQGVVHDLRVVGRVARMLQLGEYSPKCYLSATDKSTPTLILDDTCDCPAFWIEGLEMLFEATRSGVLVAGVGHVRQMYEIAPEEYANLRDFPLVDHHIFMWRGRLVRPTTSLTVYLGDEGELVSDIWFAWPGLTGVRVRRLQSVPL